MAEENGIKANSDSILIDIEIDSKLRLSLAIKRVG